jgi:hypothetical protein
MDPQHYAIIVAYVRAVNAAADARDALKSLNEQLTANSSALLNAITQNDFVAGPLGDLSFLVNGPTQLQAAIQANYALEAVLTNFATTPPTATADLAALLALRQRV